MGALIKSIIGFFSGFTGLFIFKVGDERLNAAQLGYGTKAYTLMLLTAALPILMSLMMLFAVIKSPLIKYLPPLLLLNGLLIAWFKMTL